MASEEMMKVLLANLAQQSVGGWDAGASSSTCSSGGSPAADALQLQAMQALQQQYLAAYQQQLTQEADQAQTAEDAAQEEIQEYWVRQQLAAQENLILESSRVQAASAKIAWEEEQKQASEKDRACNQKFEERLAIQEELMRRNFRSSMCKMNTEDKKCAFKDKCVFAHHYSELRLVGRPLSEGDEELVKEIALQKVKAEMKWKEYTAKCASWSENGGGGDSGTTWGKEKWSGSGTPGLSLQASALQAPAAKAASVADTVAMMMKGMQMAQSFGGAAASASGASDSSGNSGGWGGSSSDGAAWKKARTGW